MLLNEPGNCIQLNPVEAPSTLQSNGFQPELCHHVFAPDMDVGRLVAIQGHEKETIGAYSENRRHVIAILLHRVESNLNQPVRCPAASSSRQAELAWNALPRTVWPVGSGTHRFLPCARGSKQSLHKRVPKSRSAGKTGESTREQRPDGTRARRSRARSECPRDTNHRFVVRCNRQAWRNSSLFSVPPRLAR